jgi:hypothetical protein
MEFSHKTTEEFYRNATQCTFTDPSGKKIYFDYAHTINFEFV